MTEAPGSERWNWLAEGNATQARKRVAVDVLITNDDGQILVVNPSYKKGWDLPGGMSEANEKPRQTAVRELAEELGVAVKPHELLLIEWTAPHGPWDDLLTVVFRGVLEASQPLYLADEELLEFRFVESREAVDLMPDRAAKRLELAINALKTGDTCYVENDASHAGGLES